LHFDQLAKNNFLRSFLGDLAEHGRGRRLMIIKATAWHTPSAGDGGSSGVLGRQQATTRGHYCVRRETLPDSRSYLLTEYQPGIASLAAHQRTWFVAYRTYQQPKN
jgi:hypothetical protein